MTLIIIHAAVAVVLLLTVLVLHGADRMHRDDVPAFVFQSVFWPVFLVAFLAVEFGMWLKARGYLK
jgi:hypothetical protein